MNNIITAIDLGSNSFRVVKYDFLQNKIIDEYQDIVGLAEAIPSTNKISKESEQRVIDAIFKSSKKLNYIPKSVVAVTTAAMRYASNSLEVIKNIKEKTGINFRIIEAQEEARLTLLAIKFALKRENIYTNNFIVLDIGGGSTELIINSSENYMSKSFSYGIVTIAQKYKNIEKLNENTKELIELKKEMMDFVSSLELNLNNYSFIATAGTPTIIAATKVGLNANNYDRNLVNGTTVFKDDITNIYNSFLEKDEKELNTLLGNVKYEYIKVGTIIYKFVYEIVQKNSSKVFDDGLREGVAIDYFLQNYKQS